MKVVRLFFFTLVAIAFGAIAGVIIGSITLGAGILILRDAILSPYKHPPDNGSNT